MNHSIRYIGLLFAVVLAFAGVQERSAHSVQHGVAQAAEGEQAQASLTGGELLKSPALSKGAEQLIVVHQLPSSPSKTNPAGFALSAFAFELRMQRIASRYMLYSKHLHRSLTSGAIIFPFHYFW